MVRRCPRYPPTPWRRRSDPDLLIAAAGEGDRRALARLLTLVEAYDETGRTVLSTLFPATGDAWTVGLTGAPGAGKSTLTSRLIESARGAGSSVSVVAVDPSSPFSGGAILGDRVRMQDHINDAGVYIRSLATRGHLGGISEATPRCVTVLDGIGFDEIMVETVGVGQAEVDIAANTDTTVVVAQPPLGGQHPGGQGGSARDRRRVRRQQGGPARSGGDGARPAPDAGAGRHRGLAARRSSPPSPRPARAPASCGTPSPATAATWWIPAVWPSAGAPGWSRSCATRWPARYGGGCAAAWTTPPGTAPSTGW